MNALIALHSSLHKYLVQPLLTFCVLTLTVLLLSCDSDSPDTKKSHANKVNQQQLSAAALAKKMIAQPVDEAHAITLSYITPTGEDVPTARQVSFTFNKDVVPLGRMQRTADEIPIHIEPALNCQWHWLNLSSLACELTKKDQLALATRYTVSLWQDPLSEDGKRLEAPVTHEFITQRPRLKSARLQSREAPGLPVYRVRFNQPVFKESVQKAVFFRMVNESSDEIGVNVMVNPNTLSKAVPYQTKKINSYWLIQPQSPLPLDTEYEIASRDGLHSALGDELGIVDLDNDAVYSSYTLPDFSFEKFSCYFYRENEHIRLSASGGDLSNCSPESPVYLAFSSMFSSKSLQGKLKLTLRGEDTNLLTDEYWKNVSESDRRNSNHYEDRLYSFALPMPLAPSTEYTLTIDPSVRDSFNRPLSNSTGVFNFSTDQYQPYLDMPYNHVVLETGVSSEFPVTGVNHDSIDFTYGFLTADGQRHAYGKDYELRPNMDLNERWYIAASVRDWLNEKSGYVYGLLEPELHDYPEEFFVQVTPYQVHVKLGHFNTLIWVTDLATGAAVEGVDVGIYFKSLASLRKNSNTDFISRTNAQGIAILDGLDEIDPDLEKMYNYCDADESFNCKKLIVKVDGMDAMAVMPLNYKFKSSAVDASDYDVYSNLRQKHGHMHAWGTTAQGVYREGDTIEYKIYVRDQNNNTLTNAPRSKYSLSIVDPMGQEVESRKNIQLNEFGTLDGSYELLEGATSGWYSFVLEAEELGNTFYPMRVLVSDFTPASFRVSTELNGTSFHKGDKLTVTSQATLHSGGNYTDALARVNIQLSPSPFHPENAEARKYTYSNYSEANSYDAMTLLEDEKIIDGDLITEHQLINDVLYGKLTVETAVIDDRGKYIADNAFADYFSVDRFVGLKDSQWLYTQGETEHINFVVVDQSGQPLDNVEVEIVFEQEEIIVAKVKGAGNVYEENTEVKWVKFDHCKTVSKATLILGEQTCEFTPKKAGTIRAIATIKDSKGHTVTSALSMWVTGSDYVYWADGDSKRITIIPEKDDYKVGDTARYMIKNPFPNAQALISIERYGVLDHWVQTVDSSTPVIEFEIKEDYLPGFYLSVVIVSPRVDAPLPKYGEVDMGKPAMRMGYIEVPVKDPYKQMNINISSDKKEYRPAEKVQLSINATPEHPANTYEKTELAVIVLDEAVFDLIKSGKRYFDPYQGLYSLDDLDVENYNLLTRLLGRQNFEKKGGIEAGDGGDSSASASIQMRSLFKYVSYWNPSLVTDAAGNATVEFTLPDNLTGWRVLVLAATPSDRIGLGDYNFKTNKPTEIQAVMPNQLVETDKFTAGFTVFNRSKETRTLTVEITAKGALKALPVSQQKITVAPYKRYPVRLPIETIALATTRAVKEGSIDFTITAYDDLDGDKLQYSVPVQKMRSLVTAANYGASTDAQVVDALQFPQDIYPDVGEVSVDLSPSVIGNVAGAFDYVRDYPYWCWEQRLTKASMASHFVELKSYLPEDLTWEESQTLPARMLKDASKFQAPNGGMTYWTAQNDYVSPYLSAYTALAFNWLEKRGKKAPKSVTKGLSEYLISILYYDQLPSYYSSGMSSTVRAVALAALAPNGGLSLHDLNRYRSHLKDMSLFGQAHYLQAAITLADKSKKENASSYVEEAVNMIMAKSTQTGGKIAFNETLDSNYQRMLDTPVRAQCAILSAFTQLNASKKLNTLVPEGVAFKLVRNISQARGRKAYWSNTQENIFCMNAMIDYAKQFESVTPNMVLDVAIRDGHDDESASSHTLGTTQFTSVRDKKQTLSQPIHADDRGTKKDIVINKSGQGRFYYTTKMRYAPLEKASQRINSGMDLRKEYSVEKDGGWQLVNNKDVLKRGDLVKVDIYLSLPTARHYVVVDDPIPGGLEVVNSDLGTASTVDANKADKPLDKQSFWYTSDDWNTFGSWYSGFYHKELRHDSARFYSDYLNAGDYLLSYTAQVIADGSFAMMPVHAEEMYDPDVFGKGLAKRLNVAEQ